jgi:hypothetical protein
MMGDADIDRREITQAIKLFQAFRGGGRLTRRWQRGDFQSKSYS